MSTLVKTIQTELLAIQQVNANVNVVGSAFDVSTKFAGTVMWDFAAISTQATPAQTEFCLQASQKATGTDTWVNLFTWLSTGVVSPASGVVNSTAGGPPPTVTSTISISTSTNVYFFLQNATLGLSEWCRRIGQSGGGPYTVTVEDNVTNNQNGSTVWAIAERYKFDIDFSSITRIRVVIGNNRSAAVNRAVVVRVALITADSIS